MSKFFDSIGNTIENILVTAPSWLRWIYIKPVMYFFTRTFKSLIEEKNDMTVIGFAKNIVSYFPGGYNIGQVCSIVDKINYNFKYVYSVETEGIRSAKEQILYGFYGSCEEYSVLIAALVGSIGGSVRLVFALGKGDGHVYPEVFIGNLEDVKKVSNFISKFYLRYQQATIGHQVIHINFHRDPNGNYWLSLDMNPYLYAGNFYFDSIYEIALYPNGEYNEIYIKGY